MKKITTTTREYDDVGRVIKEVTVEEEVKPTTYPGTYQPSPLTPHPLPYQVWCNTAGDCQ